MVVVMLPLTQRIYETCSSKAEARKLASVLPCRVVLLEITELLEMEESWGPEAKVVIIPKETGLPSSV